MKDGGESCTFLVIWQLATETVDTVWWAKGPEPSPSNVGVLSPTRLANQPEHASSTTTHMQYVRAPPGDRSSWAGELSSTRALPIAARQMRSYRSLPGSRACHLQGPLVSKVLFSKILVCHLQGPSTITSLPGSQASMINVHIERRVRSRPRHL